MQRFYSRVGVIGFCMIVGRFAFLYGRQWEFSPRGIPVSIVAADGISYPDGERINEFTLALIRSGSEEGVMATMLSAFVTGFVILTFKVVLQYRRDCRTQLILDLVAEGKRLDAAGRRAEGDKIVRRLEKLLGRPLGGVSKNG